VRFNTLTFIVFFAIVLVLHHLPFTWRAKKRNLLIASYLFYAAWNPPFVSLLAISTLVDWFVAKALGSAVSVRKRRVLLVVSLGVNLGLLGFFKYSDFLLESFVSFLGSVGVQYQAPRLGIILPVGISFYTFQTLSYTLDVYMGKARPWHSFLDYALFVSFFPQLVAGPIVRAVDFLPQCIEPRRATATQMGWGLSLLTLGLFEKVVLADYFMAPTADLVYSAAANAGFVDAWLGTLAFSGQIFFDFAGYSTCAIGVGMCLGFALPDNFRFPYAAVGFSDFWRRWHVSLSTWLRDYLYIPLGGSRKGTTRTQINVMLTMLLGGLWHGASWRFVAWGGLHGIYLVIERGVRYLWGGGRLAGSWLVKASLALLTYFLVCITWAFFRAPDFPSAFRIVKTMLTGAPNQLAIGRFNGAMVLLITAGLLGSHWLLRDGSVEQAAAKCPWWLIGLILAVMLLCIVLLPGDNRAFIYFQF